MVAPIDVGRASPPDPSRREPLDAGVMAGLFLLSAATLTFEITLTRLFSVAQFYHFAFMIVSLAMLGFGASGTWLVVWPRWGRRHPRLTLTGLAVAYGVCVFGAYFFINTVPFDSFSIAWDVRQVVVLVLHYLALSLPFFCSGAILSLLFALYPASVGSLYAVNLSGSALGCVMALVLPNWVLGEGPVWISGGLGGCTAFLLSLRAGHTARPAVGELGASGTSSTRVRFLHVRALRIAALLLFAFAVLLVLWRPAFAELMLSPYKALSYALQVPDVRIIYQDWNGFSRVDLVDSPTIRSLPGLSYRYPASPPAQHGLFVDGDDLTPVLQVPLSDLDEPQAEALQWAACMPTAIAYRLRPEGHALVLAPQGGLEVWIALTQGASRVVAVEPNPLVARAVGPLYAEASRVSVVLEEPRSFVRRAGRSAVVPRSYDVVTLALTAPYRPIRSGAYSLGEDYRYTTEAFRDYLTRLTPDGVLVVSRWVQTPPSESLRAFALAVTAVEAEGGDPSQQIVAFRGYAMMTFLIKRQPFTDSELAAIRGFADEQAFDLVIAPDIRAGEANRYNVMPTPVYYEAFTELLTADDRDAWYAAYPFDVRPPTDNHPFFAHFYKWSQAREIVAELGKTWQPFGGAGYFVLLALLVFSLGAAGVLIGLPAVVFWRSARQVGPSAPPVKRPALDLAYFGLLGVGYLFVEIPLMQRAILFLGHPAYAVTAVLFALLFWSGVGSALVARLHLRHRLGHVLIALVVLVAIYALVLPTIFGALLGLSWGIRVVVTILLLAPGGFLMGIPFPTGLAHLSARTPAWVPWAWAVNGALSVVASVLSALVALSAGFAWVLVIGALSYGAAWLIARRWRPGTGAQKPETTPTPSKGLRAAQSPRR
ncbi:MAG: hypothetical protein ACP5HG_11135 [Anaerolineae bacterium]